MKAPGPKRKGPHLYKGELAKPLLAGVYLPDKAYLTDKMKAAELDACLQQAVYERRIEKLALLMEHYGIADRTDYFSLALKLATAHVPGFRIGHAHELLKLEHDDYGAVLGNKRGRRTDWPPERLFRLLNAVEEAKKRHGFSISTDREAIRFIIMQKGEWNRPIDRDEQKWIETLESRLQDAKRIRREERDGGPALDPESEAILRELQEAVQPATATVSAAAVYATLPLELRFAALCLPFSVGQSSGN